MYTLKKYWLLSFFLLVAAGCSSETALEFAGSASGKASTSSLNIVATTGQINSALTRLLDGTNANVKLFCGPGVDPHSFSASTADVQAMLNADLIVYNGFHLEAKLSEHLHGKFENKAWSMASAFPEQFRLDWVEDGEVDPEAPFDPHIWNHLPAWIECVTALGAKLGDVDPANKEIYAKNAEAYVGEIMEVHNWAKEKLAEIPDGAKTIVSAHDAFNYFAKVYDMDTLAVLGIGNDAEADIKTMRTVAETICEKKIPAIFMESITNPKVTEALQEACQARNWQVNLVDRPLYSDDLGEKVPLNTFLGAFRSNVELIVASLNPQTD